MYLRDRPREGYYEESGWYDGQVWIKPLVLKEKESLIASIEVKPI